MERNKIYVMLANETRNSEPKELTSHLLNLEEAAEKAQDAFTYNPQANEVEAMLDAVQKVAIASMEAIKDLGVSMRGSDEKTENPTLDDIKAAFDSERDYQETSVRENYGTEGRVFSLLAEITMINSYTRNEVTHKYFENDLDGAIEGIRKVGAMAIRCLEAHGVEQEVVR